MKSQVSVLFLGKRGDAHCLRALGLCDALFAHVDAYLGAWGEPLPICAASWSGDLILSYLSRWVVKPPLLERPSLGALNFHPATPDYPGIGCVNFALYDGVAEYGATCHHMASVVDTGRIVAVRRVPVLPGDGVASLLDRTYNAQFALFCEIVSGVAIGASLPTSPEVWTRPPYTRVEFNRLLEITADMSESEVARRIRATSYMEFQPYVTAHGRKFYLRAE